MSEETASNTQVFILEKCNLGDVFFYLHPLSNASLTKSVYLTSRLPRISLSKDWALGVFLDNGIYSMLKQGIIAFKNQEAAFQAAQEAGVLFDAEIAELKDVQKIDYNSILTTLKSGVRSSIVELEKKYGREVVKSTAVKYLNDIPQGVVTLLEKMWNIQLTINQE